MHNDVIESLWLGGCIGVAIIVLRALAVNTMPQTQLLWLLAAAAVIAGGQLAFTSWLKRRGNAPSDPPDEQAPSFLQRRRNRRNPFFRELTHEWTGLDERGVDGDNPGAVAADLGASPSGDQPDPHGRP